MKLLLFLLLSISSCLMYFIKARAKYYIGNSKSADESCYWRKKFGIYRLLVGSIYPIGLLIYLLNTPVSESKGFVIGLTSAWTAICLTALPIYAIRPDQIKKKHFILYLRGFSQDNYSQTMKELNKDVKGSCFSEGHFIHLLKQYMPVYAVGMTKEFEAPHGALRVYLNDVDWEEEVEILMDKATLIVILVNDSESCIWELRRARKYKDKIVYICDNQDKVISVRGLSSKSYESILPIGLHSGRICYYDDSKRNNESISYDNSDRGYASVIHAIMRNKFNLHRWIISNRKDKQLTYIFSIISIPIIFGVMMYVELNSSLKEDRTLFITLMIIAITGILLIPRIIYDILYARSRNIKLSNIEM